MALRESLWDGPAPTLRSRIGTRVHRIAGCWQEHEIKRNAWQICKEEYADHGKIKFLDPLPT